MDELQGTAEISMLNPMDEIMKTKVKLSKLKHMIEDHPIDQEVEECATLIEKVKEVVE